VALILLILLRINEHAGQILVGPNALWHIQPNGHNHNQNLGGPCGAWPTRPTLQRPNALLLAVTTATTATTTTRTTVMMMTIIIYCRSSPESNVGSFAELVTKLHGPVYSRDEVQPVYRPLVTNNQSALPSPGNGCDVIDDVIVSEQVPAVSASPPPPEIIGKQL